ncbi:MULTISPECIES: hypothetical protein [Brevibacillus]|uniref:hypothetical protein n=1 Tax=Brevibacillus TaxID=55080 RepID=UPI001304D8FF|nr:MULTISPECIES: hypothetical protein [Brevibacillus]MED1948899.1 hypothetical protein [Brevibacillus formosus]MED2001422.1 hypothetical protein [Brevibacillus formosus]MED2085507.1 hypothetical protein [Brevibacillus formosus]
MFWGILLAFIVPVLVLGYVADRQHKKKVHLNEINYAGKENITHTFEAEAISRTFMDRP